MKLVIIQDADENVLIEQSWKKKCNDCITYYYVCIGNYNKIIITQV